MDSPNLPRSTSDVKRIARVLRLVFSIPRYAVLTVLTTPVMLAAFVVPRNLQLFLTTATSPGGVGEKVGVFASLLPSPTGVSYSIETTILLYLAAAFVSVNLVLTFYHFREHDLTARDGASNTAGAVLGALGAGCASCGSALLAGVLSLLGIGGLVTALPLEGGEVLIIAVIVSVFSMHWIAEGLRGGVVNGCPIE